MRVGQLKVEENRPRRKKENKNATFSFFCRQGNETRQRENVGQRFLQQIQYGGKRASCGWVNHLPQEMFYRAFWISSITNILRKASLDSAEGSRRPRWVRHGDSPARNRGRIGTDARQFERYGKFAENFELWSAGKTKDCYLLARRSEGLRRSNKAFQRTPGIQVVDYWKSLWAVTWHYRDSFARSGPWNNESHGLLCPYILRYTSQTGDHRARAVIYKIALHWLSWTF